MTPSRSLKGRGAADVLLEDNPIGRSIVFRKARESVMARTQGHYPAPLAALDAVHVGYEKGPEAGYQDEARRFGEMAASDVCKELIFLFFATTALKKDRGVAEPDRRTIEQRGPNARGRAVVE